jgi:hypothetical protein
MWGAKPNSELHFPQVDTKKIFAVKAESIYSLLGQNPLDQWSNMAGSGPRGLDENFRIKMAEYRFSHG